MDVVCGTDFSPEARRAADTAGALAARLGGKVLLVHALELPTVGYVAGDAVLFPPTQAQREEMRGEADRVLAAEAARVADVTGARVEGQLDIGTPEESVLDAVKRTKAGLVVVGTRGHRAPVRWILGSTTQRLAASCPVPLLVTRGESPAFLEWARGTRTLRVLVAADLEESFAYAAGFVAALERAGRTEVHLAHACELAVGPADRYSYPFLPALPVRRADVEPNIRQEMRRHAEAAGLPHASDSLHVVWGKAPAAIARFAQEGAFDLVVAGTHARRGLERAILGSVASGLLLRARGPVLIAPFPAES